MRRRTLAALALGVAALVFRLWGLGRESLWVDEAASWAVARQSVAAIFAQPEQTPPLYNLLLHFWMQVAGASEAALRFPSALFGSAAVAMLYLVARRFVTAPYATLGAVLAILNFHFIRSSQNARTYALFMLLALLSIHALLRVLEGSRRARVGYAIATALLLYSHVYGLFLFAGQVTYAFALRNKHGAGARLLWLQGIALIPFLAWVPILISRASAVTDGFWIRWDQVLAGANLGGGSWPADLGLVAGVVVGLFVLPRVARHPKVVGAVPRPRLLIGTWVLLPFAIPVVLSVILGPIVSPTYTIAAWPGILLLTMAGLQSYRRRTATILAILLLTAACFAATDALTSRQNQDWRATFETLDREATPGDLVLFTPGYCGDSSERLQCPYDYYGTRKDLRFVPFLDGYRQVGTSDLDALNQTLAGESSVWLVESDGGDPEGHIASRLGTTFVLESRLEPHRLRLTHWVAAS
ncbi:MAG: glycosyltransferase family 39 protein [Candidatus Thermoplasmatota archaeon]